MTTIDEFLAVFQKKKHLTRWAKQTGFCQRPGKLAPFDFVALMTLGQMGMPHPSLAGLVTALDTPISRVALHYRFSAAAAAFLLKCLHFVLNQKVSGLGVIDTTLLRPFRRVLVVDSSSWDVNERLRTVLPGSGGGASAANCKLQTAYEYKRGVLDFFEVTAGTVPDNGYTAHLPGFLGKNDLLLIDQGYFKLQTLGEIAAKGAFFLTRFPVRTVGQEAQTQTPIELATYLSQVAGSTCDLEVLMGRPRVPQVACRLIALRVSDHAANTRRRRLKTEAKRKGRAVSMHQLRMCDWTLLITNVPSPWLPVEMVRMLYTVRWQIELLFKQLKSILRIHHSTTGKEARLRCELYGKLIGAVLIHRIHAGENARYWNTHHREVSMDKLYKRMQERAFTLLRLVRASMREAETYLHDQLQRIIPACLKERQRSRLTTLECLAAQYDPVHGMTRPERKKRAA